MYGDNGRPLEHCTSAYAVVHQRSSSIQQLHIVVHHSVPARFTRIVAVSPYRQVTAGPHCKFRFFRTWIRVQRGLEVHIARQYRAAPHYTSPPGGDPSRQGHARVSGLLPPGACGTPDSVNAPPAGWVVHTRPSQSPSFRSRSREGEWSTLHEPPGDMSTPPGSREEEWSTLTSPAHGAGGLGIYDSCKGEWSTSTSLAHGILGQHILGS